MPWHVCFVEMCSNFVVFVSPKLTSHSLTAQICVCVSVRAYIYNAGAVCVLLFLRFWLLPLLLVMMMAICFFPFVFRCFIYSVIWPVSYGFHSCSVRNRLCVCVLILLFDSTFFFFFSFFCEKIIFWHFECSCSCSCTVCNEEKTPLPWICNNISLFSKSDLPVLKNMCPYCWHSQSTHDTALKY